MSLYAYSAVDGTGELVRGNLEADDEAQAANEVGARGLYLVSLRRTSDRLAGARRYLRAMRVSRADFIELAQNLSIMQKAGIPILTSLEDIAASTANPAFRGALQEIKQRVARGSSVSAALEAQGTLFPEILKKLVAVGEQTGRFDESLREAADHLLRMQNLASAIKQALMYPAFAVATTMGALVFWLAFVLPKLITTMKGMGVTLPPLTVMLIFVSGLFQRHWLLILMSPALVPLGVALAGRNRRSRYLRDLLLVRIPIVKLIVYNKTVAVFAEQFRILVVAGTSIDRLFDLIIPSLDNEYFAVNLRAAKEQILHGALISESLKARNFLPPLVIRMVNIGETSGTLDSQLEFLAAHYSKKLDDATAILGKLVEPVVMVVVGGLFAVIIMGLMLPMYDLVSKMAK